VDALGNELVRLRRGRGVMAEDLPGRLGPVLCSMAGLESGGNVEDIRKRLIQFLEDLAVALPEDLRIAFAAALALPEDVRVLYGGSLIKSTWPTATYLRYAIRLPQSLRHGQSHELGISITIPRGQPFNPRYAIQPLRRCDEFDPIGQQAPNGAPRILEMAVQGRTDELE